MKRFLMLVAVAAVAGVMYVAASPASQQSRVPTLKQFNALKKQVASQGKTLKQVVQLAVAEGVLLIDCSNQGALAVDQFGDTQNQTEGYRYTTHANLAAPASDTLTSAMDFAVPTDQSAVFFMGGDSTCATDLNSNAIRHAAAKAGIQLPRLAHAHSFIARRP